MPPKGPYTLVTVNKVPERAWRLIARVVELLKDQYTILHVGNCETIESVEETITKLRPDVLFCASMWTSQESQNIQSIAKKIVPEIKTYAIPHGLQDQKGPEGVVEHLKEVVPRILGG